MVNRLKIGLSVVLLASSSASLRAMNCGGIDYSINGKTALEKIPQWNNKSDLITRSATDPKQAIENEKKLLGIYLDDIVVEQEIEKGNTFLSRRLGSLRKKFEERLVKIEQEEMRTIAGDLTIVATPQSFQADQCYALQLLASIESKGDNVSDINIREIQGLIESCKSCVARITLRKDEKLADQEEEGLADKYNDLRAQCVSQLDKVQEKRANDLGFVTHQVQQLLDQGKN